MLIRSSLDRLEASGPDVPPLPYLANPQQQETLHGDVPIFHGRETLLMAEDLRDKIDVRSAVFEFSQDGLLWHFIGVDDNPNYEGPIPSNVIDENNVVLSCCISEGRAGFSTLWNTSALTEGIFFVRLKMEDLSRRRAAAFFPLYFDPTPPLLELGRTPEDGEIVHGKVQLLISSPATRLQFQMAFLQDARNPVDQRGLGTDRQTDIFPVRRDGTNMFCGPTATKNSLWRLAATEPRFRQVPDAQLAGYRGCFQQHARAMAQPYDESRYLGANRMLTNLGLAVILACKMRTQADTGTTNDNLLAGLRSFLREQELERAYTATSTGTNFRNFHAGLNRGEDVGVQICFTISGRRFCHYLTGQDAAYSPPRGPHTASFVDPATGTTFNTTWDGSVIQYPSQVRRRDGTTRTVNVPATVESVLTVSPTGSPVWIPITVQCHEVSAGQFTCAFDSRALRDGFYAFRIVATDTQNHIGVTFINLFVDN